ncbi:hypothetical protein BTJ39_12070 [Izhakiella australiensis]|uniref:Peptidase S24/S26A/S26B/S26C domain-containing protein n=1 Tax=Izhakiella australiensis TaxID=1926881 RepID=A0A1S8YLY7_9GAMM|nr:S24 family peptidase [Izhakiella australiensis]OON39766.1 hypothetical protein BTJ39_12070 [Izhakiella australiensis]
MDKFEKRRRRLQQLRDEFCNGKIVELARRIEREPSYVSRMLYAENKAGRKRIADEMMEVIEQAFNLPRGWMDGLISEGCRLSTANNPPQVQQFPLLSWEQAANWPNPQHISVEELEWYDSGTPVIGDAFWLKMHGDSMTSSVGLSIPEGMLILFDSEKKAVIDSLVLAKMANSGEVTFKKLISDAGFWYLKALNPAFPLIPLGDACSVIAVAIEARIYFA